MRERRFTEDIGEVVRDISFVSKDDTVIFSATITLSDNVNLSDHDLAVKAVGWIEDAVSELVLS